MYLLKDRINQTVVSCLHERIYPITFNYFLFYFEFELKLAKYFQIGFGIMVKLFFDFTTLLKALTAV